MSDEEVRAWSLLIVSVLNEYECKTPESFLCQKQLIEGVENYIKSGKIPDKLQQPEGLHPLKKKIYDVNIKNKEIIC